MYIEILTGFSHILSPDGFNNTLLSQSNVLGTFPTVGETGRRDIPRIEESVRSLSLPGSSSWVNWLSRPQYDLLQHGTMPTDKVFPFTLGTELVWLRVNNNNNNNKKQLIIK